MPRGLLDPLDDECPQVEVTELVGEPGDAAVRLGQQRIQSGPVSIRCHGDRCLPSGYLPAPVAKPGDHVNAAAQRGDVGAHDLNARDLTVLDLGYAGLGHAEGSGQLRLRHPGRGAHLSELVAAHVGVPALTRCGLGGRLLSRILYWQGREGELRALADASGRADTVSLLADLLADQGRVDEAIAEVRRIIADFEGPWFGAGIVPSLLWRHGRTEELAALAAGGNGSEPEPLTEPWVAAILLTHDRPPRSHDVNAADDDGHYPEEKESSLLPRDQLHETIEHLKARSADGDESALKELAEVMGKHGLVDDLRALVAGTGSLDALTQLWGLLRRLGRHDERAAFVRYGLNPDGTFATAFTCSWTAL